MSETPKKQYGFIGDLMESRMFRSKSKVEDTNAREMADFAMMNLLALYILSNEYDCCSGTRLCKTHYDVRQLLIQL